MAGSGLGGGGVWPGEMIKTPLTPLPACCLTSGGGIYTQLSDTQIVSLGEERSHSRGQD